MSVRVDDRGMTVTTWPGDDLPEGVCSIKNCEIPPSHHAEIDIGFGDYITLRFCRFHSNVRHLTDKGWKRAQ